MRRTSQLSLIFGALLAGVAIGRGGFISINFGLVLIAFLTAALAFRTRLFFGLLVLSALLLGLWRTSTWTAARLEQTNLIGQTITVMGQVADDPSINQTSGQVDFKLGDVTMDGRKLPGTISVHDYSVRLQRGYRVQLNGKMKAGFGNAAVAMSFPQVQVLSTSQNWLEKLRQRFFVGIRTALPEPISSFGLGLLVGIRALVPKNMQTELTLVGLSHLVAVSGYNLTIIVRAVDRSLKRFGRGIALAVSLWLIFGFLVVTGASASIVRASLISVLSLLAAFYGLKFNPLTLILIAAGITAAVEPGYLTDLGWLLSFLAFFGILVLSPAIEARLGHPRLIVVRLLIESTAAQVLTLPLILFIFSQLSVVEPISNMLVLPMVPLAMAVTFMAGLAGMIVPAFAGWFAWPAMLVLNFMTGLIDKLAALPWAGHPEHLSLTGMLAMYAVIAVGTIIIHRRTAESRTKGPGRARVTEVAIV